MQFIRKGTLQHLTVTPYIGTQRIFQLTWRLHTWICSAVTPHTVTVSTTNADFWYLLPYTPVTSDKPATSISNVAAADSSKPPADC